MTHIPDPNLRLTFLQCLWDEELLPTLDKEAFYRDTLGEEYDPSADYNDMADPRVRNHLLSIELPDTLLAQLKIVDWDVGSDVFQMIWTNWDGETDEFDLTDLTGIEACRSMETLEVLSGGGLESCAALAGLPALRRVTLLGGWIKDASPLQKLPSLKKLEIAAAPTEDNQRVFTELRAAGVKVTVHSPDS